MELRSGPRSQELELETLAASRAAVSKRGLDDFAVRDILFEHLGRKLECECQVLYDERELRKEALRRQFGVDFDSGEVGLVD